MREPCVAVAVEFHGVRFPRGRAFEWRPLRTGVEHELPPAFKRGIHGTDAVREVGHLVLGARQFLGRVEELEERDRLGWGERDRRAGVRGEQRGIDRDRATEGVGRHAASVVRARWPTFARTNASASGGHTLLPTMRTCAVLVSGFPLNGTSITYASLNP